MDTAYINADQHTYSYADADSDIHAIEYTYADSDIYAFQYADANSHSASGFTSQDCLHPFAAGQFAVVCYQFRGYRCKMASARLESEKTFRSHQNFL